MKNEDLNLEGELNTPGGKEKTDLFGRKYHMVVLEKGGLNNLVRVKLITSPFGPEKELDPGTEIILQRDQYEKVRLNPSHYDLEKDPELKEYKFSEKLLRNQVRAYNPIILMEIKNSFGMDIDDE